MNFGKSLCQVGTGVLSLSDSAFRYLIKCYLLPATDVGTVPPTHTDQMNGCWSYIRTYIHTYIHTYVHTYIHSNCCYYFESQTHVSRGYHVFLWFV